MHASISHSHDVHYDTLRKSHWMSQVFEFFPGDQQLLVKLPACTPDGVVTAYYQVPGLFFVSCNHPALVSIFFSD